MDWTYISIQLAASALTMAAAWKTGDKSVSGPAIGLVSQIAWWGITLYGGTWGLLPVNIAMTVINTRNLIKWMKDKNEV